MSIIFRVPFKCTGFLLWGFPACVDVVYCSQYRRMHCMAAWTPTLVSGLMACLHTFSASMSSSWIIYLFCQTYCILYLVSILSSWSDILLMVNGLVLLRLYSLTHYQAYDVVMSLSCVITVTDLTADCEWPLTCRQFCSSSYWNYCRKTGS